MNNLAPVKNCPREVQGSLNWMPGYKGGIEQSISRISVWHHEDFKQCQTAIVRDGFFYPILPIFQIPVEQLMDD